MVLFVGIGFLLRENLLIKVLGMRFLWPGMRPGMRPGTLELTCSQAGKT